jgi:hypothetical protein
MALTFVKRSTLPAAIRGKAGTLSVSVTVNGQIVLSALSTAALNGATKVVMAFEGAKAYVFPSTAAAVKKVAEADMIGLNKAKKGGTVSFSGAAILRAAMGFGASHVYDFKTSGNQSFPVTVHEKEGCLSFELPTHLTKRPVTARKPRAKKVAAGTQANPGSTDGTPVGQNAQKEPELQLA